MSNCNKINTCGEFNTSYATCVIYEGNIPDYSKYVDECSITVEEAIEELYTLVSGTTPTTIEYYNGEGLNLTNRVFSVKFGLTDETVMRGSWRPDWEDIKNKPNLTEPVNIIEGDNIRVTGVYPNLTISSQSVGQVNIIEKISLGGTQSTIVDKTAIIPIASQNVLGLVKIGTGLNIATDGTLTVTPNNYTAGAGLTLVGNQFSMPVTVTGTGSFVQSVTQTTNGLSVVLGTPSGASIPSGTLQELQTGTLANDRVWSPAVINQWYNNNRLSINALVGNPVIAGTVRLLGGSNVTVTQSGGDFTISATSGTTYTAGSGISINSGVINNTSPNIVQNLSLSGSTLTLSNGGGSVNLPSGGSTYTAGNGLTLTGTQFSLPVVTVGSGSVVQSVTQTTTGIQVSLSNPLLAQTQEVTNNMSVTLKGEIHTAIFIDSSANMVTVTIPKGQFDGQLISVFGSGSGDRMLQGDFRVWDETNPPNNVSTLSGNSVVKLFWSESNNMWMVSNK